MKRSRLLSTAALSWGSVFILLLLWLAPTSSSAQSTISVFVPGYRSENWEDLAGSVVASDSTATTYTIFCLDTADCEISGPFPFTFAEGPSTFQYSGTVASKLTAAISCKLASTTAATCTEYSSFGAGYTVQNVTGPTEVSRTQTYSGREVQWGVLTLSSALPASPTTAGGGGLGTINPTGTAWFFPSATSATSAAASASWRGPGVFVGLAVTAAAVGLLLVAA